MLTITAGCGSGDGSPSGAAGADVVVTTSIWADVVANVACDGSVEIETIVPAGGDPHAFEPSLADRGRMEDATLVVANGLLLEEGLEDTLEAVEDAGTPVFRIGDQAPSEDADPHVWFDPVWVAGVLPQLADALVEHAGLDAGALDACVAGYQAELAAVDDEIVDLVAELPPGRRVLVTSHDSLGYFADRYGFEVLGTVIPAPSSLAETNPAQLERLAELIEETGVRAIFAESQHSTDDAEALAARVGAVEVVTLLTGTLGEAGGGADTYVGFLRTNAARITEALGADG